MSPIITPEELRHLLEQPRKPVLVDVRSADAYAAGHIPSAFSVQSDSLRPLDTTMEGLYGVNETLDKLYRVVGHFEKVEFLVYGDRTDARTARVLWLMHYSGLLHARLLDGGLEAWKAGDGPLTTDPTPSDPTHFGVRGRRELVARYDEVEKALEDPAGVLIDCRSEAEWQSAALPNAKNFDAACLFDEATGRFVDFESLRPALEALGLERRTPAILYSEFSERSAAACLALRALGFRKVRNFLGGWNEWRAKQTA